MTGSVRVVASLDVGDSSKARMQLRSTASPGLLSPGLRVIHPEHVPGSICIPPAPDASASTLPARAPCAGCGVHFNRQVNELLHEEAYFLNHAPSCDGTAHGEV